MRCAAIHRSNPAIVQQSELSVFYKQKKHSFAVSNFTVTQKKRRVSASDLHGGDVFAREGIGGVADEQTCLTHSPGMRNERKSVIWRDKDEACWLHLACSEDL